MMYPWLLFGHLLGVVLLVTGWGVYVATVDGCRRAETIAQLRTLTRLCRVGERVLAVGGLLLIGFGLALVAEFYSFSQPWIIAALGVVAVQGLLGATVVGPRVRGLDAALKDAWGGRPSDMLSSRARDRALHISNRASIPMLIDIEFLMSVKPDFKLIVLSFVAVATLALALIWPILADHPRQSASLPTHPQA